MTYTKDQIALACLSCGVAGDTIKQILELLPDGETPSLPGPVDRLFYSVKCMKACEGLPDGAIDGGWTAAGMSAYAKKLEVEIERLRSAQIVGYLPTTELSRLASGHDAMLRSAKLGPSALDGDVTVFLEADAEIAVDIAGQPDRLFYSVPEEKILGITEAALENAGRQITGVVDPDGC